MNFGLSDGGLSAANVACAEARVEDGTRPLPLGAVHGEEVVSAHQRVEEGVEDGVAWAGGQSWESVDKGEMMKSILSFLCALHNASSVPGCCVSSGNVFLTGGPAGTLAEDGVPWWHGLQHGSAVSAGAFPVDANDRRSAACGKP